MAKTVVAIFDAGANIDSVIRDLERIGVPKRHVHALSRADAVEKEERSWTERVASFFGFTGEARERAIGAAYADAMNEGDTLLIVDVDEGMVDRTASMLNQYGAIDVGARSRTGAEQAIPAAAESRTFTTTEQATMPGVVTEQATMPVVVTEKVTVAEHATVPVIQEELEVGKRVVERGGVRVHSHVEEMPVEEVVRLREEHIEVERRAVDRPATPSDTFKEVTIEMTETAEQPVVAKQARVVEEVVVAKTTEEREETIEDTVRRQEVEVEQLPLTGTGGRRG
jgi:uncharacterized protein (TIGR02271 family)